MKITAIAMAVCWLVTGCAAGPDYLRPLLQESGEKMKVRLHSAARLLALTVLATAAVGASAQSAGQWTAKLGLNQITPKVESGNISAPALPNSKADIDPDTKPIFVIGYSFTDNISAELNLGVPYRHSIVGADGIAGTGKLGSVEVLPPTAFVQYRFFTPESKFRPYVGVGVSVTNALSKRLEITVWRKEADGTGLHKLAFEHGDVVEPLSSVVATRDGKKSGTRVTAWPDAKYFDSPAISQTELQRLLRSKAVLLPGVTVTLANAKTGESQTWQYNDGLRGYLTEALAQSTDGETLIPLFEGAQFAGPDAEGFAEGEGAAWVVAWTEHGAIVRESYVNLIPTPNGGTHESGCRPSLPSWPA